MPVEAHRPSKPLLGHPRSVASTSQALPEHKLVHVCDFHTWPTSRSSRSGLVARLGDRRRELRRGRPLRESEEEYEAFLADLYTSRRAGLA